MRRALVIGLVALAGCAAIADLPDWEMGTTSAPIDASLDAPVAEAAAPDAGEDASAEAAPDADAGCPFGCPAVAYDFDEGSGTTANDRSGHGNTGAMKNGLAFAAGGVAGTALLFDGVDDQLDVGASTSLDVTGTAISILFWAKVDGSVTTHDLVLLGKGWASGVMNAPYYQYGVEYSASSNKSFDFIFGEGAGTEHGPFRMVPPAVGVWTHVAFVYDGATVKGYLDGVEKLSQAQTGPIASRTATHLRLGRDEASSQPYKGGLDDVRIYARALGAAEIAALKDAH